MASDVLNSLYDVLNVEAATDANAEAILASLGDAGAQQAPAEQEEVDADELDGPPVAAVLLPLDND